MSIQSKIIFKVIGPHAPFFSLLDIFVRASKKYGMALQANPDEASKERDAMRDARENIVDAMTSDLGDAPGGDCPEPELIPLDGDCSLRKLGRFWSFFRGDAQMRHLSIFEVEHILAAYRAGHAARSVPAAAQTCRPWTTS